MTARFPHAPRRLAVVALPLAALTALAVGSSRAGAASIGFGTPVGLAGGCGGEPSIDLDGKGNVYVSSPKGIGNVLASCQGLAASTNGAATWVSNDGGSTFGQQIGVGTLNGGGDTDTTVDRVTGNVYVADLGAVAADICVSKDKGQTYSTAVTGAETCTSPFNITGQAGPSNDREWLTVYGPTAQYAHQDVYLSYHDFATGLPEIWTSQDGGPFLPSVFPAITNPVFAQSAANGTIIAKPVIDSAGTIYELVTTQAPPPPNGPLAQLWIVVSSDHGKTFTATQVFDGSAAGANLGLVFNDLAIDGAGNLYALILGNTRGAAPPDNAYLFTSTDKGAHWTQGQVPTDGKALALASLHGGPLAGQVVFGLYHSTTATDTNTITQNSWQYLAYESTNGTSATPTYSTAVLGSVSNPGSGVVHQGQICTAGLGCTTGQLPLPNNPPGSGNRNLADFSSVTVDQNGCAVFVYADDGAIVADQSNFAFSKVNNDVTRQTSGCFPTTAATTATPTPTATAVATAGPTSAPGPTGGSLPTATTVTLPNTAAARSGGAPSALAAVLAAAATAAVLARRRRSRRG